jgi:DNA-binding transcriptional MerR regulator
LHLEKAPDAFRTISEVADEIDVPQHVLRFWESRFPQIRPMKRGGGRRYYRPDDIDLLRGVRHLLYGEGYTIRGVQRILREEGASFVQTAWRADAELPPRQFKEDPVVEAARPPAAEQRLEPNLFGNSDEAREPQSESVPAPASAPPARLVVDRENRRKLQFALDELAACRGIIEGALAGD